MAQEDSPSSSSSFENAVRHDYRFAKFQHRVEWCVQRVCFGKAHQDCFPSSDNRSEGVLDLIHSDLCGPMSSASLTTFQYYVTFIDDYSRKTWIYFLRSKKSKEVLKRFQEFKALVENQTGRRIRVLKSDNGGEYTSNKFDEFYKQEEIKRRLIVSFTP